MRRVIEIVLALSFLCASNAHLPVLQIVAWAGMITKYSQQRSLAEAVKMTFDGEHPCRMCKAIKKQQEQAPSLEEIKIASKPVYFLQWPIPWIQQLILLDSLRDVPDARFTTDSRPARMPPRTIS
jgi:hypothetical protein